MLPLFLAWVLRQGRLLRQDYSGGSGRICFADLKVKMSTLESRVQDLIDDRLFMAYWDCVSHYETTDLVLFFNTEEPSDPVSASPRLQVLAQADVPESLRAIVQKPASQAAVEPDGSNASFWLVAVFPDDEMACVAVNAKPLTP